MTLFTKKANKMTDIQISQDRTCLKIELDRPDQGNRLTYEMVLSIRDAARHANTNDDIRVVVISSSSNGFCAGEDRNDLGDWPNEFSGRGPLGSHGLPPLPQQEMISALRSCQKPTVTLLTGNVTGLGLDIAAACDHRIATETTIVSDGRVQNAEHVATGITHILPRLIGLSQATRILLLGDELTATEARRIGLIHEVYPDNDFTVEADRFVDKISALATRSYSIIKEQTIEQLDMPYEWALKHSLAIRQTNVIEDRSEAAAAFKQKREPKFSGR